MRSRTIAWASSAMVTREWEGVAGSCAKVRKRMALRFDALLEGAEDSSATFVRVPASVMKKFGGRIRVPVRVNINGAQHRTTICNMGTGPMIGVPREMRIAAGLERGHRVKVSLEVDRDERTVEVPPELAKVLPVAERRAFDSLAYSHRKEYVQWIDGAKKPETRLRRIEQVRAKLREALTPGRLPARTAAPTPQPPTRVLKT
jgi:hypothetical protein